MSYEGIGDLNLRIKTTDLAVIIVKVYQNNSVTCFAMDSYFLVPSLALSHVRHKMCMTTHPEHKKVVTCHLQLLESCCVSPHKVA